MTCQKTTETQESHQRQWKLQFDRRSTENLPSIIAPLCRLMALGRSKVVAGVGPLCGPVEMGGGWALARVDSLCKLVVTGGSGVLAGAQQAKNTVSIIKSIILCPEIIYWVLKLIGHPFISNPHCSCKRHSQAG